MTREEAKKILEAYIACESKKAHFECSEYNCDDTCPLLYDMGTVGEYNEAINMAIQALSQEPCDKCVYSTKDGYCQYDDITETIPPLEPCCDDAISREAVLELVMDYNLSMGQVVRGIHALPPVTQKPIECEDAISREELLKAIDTWDKFGYTETGCFVRITKEIDNYVPYVHLEDVITAIQKLPPVTQKSGKWIHFAQSDDCSLCGYSTGKYGSPSKYCPNCGAKMVEPQESEEQTE